MNDLRLVARVRIEDWLVRFYEPEDEIQLPWASFDDLIAYLALPRRNRLLTVVPLAMPHHFRRAENNVTAISALMVAELLADFTSAERARLWRASAVDIFIDHCRADSPDEWWQNMRAAGERSHEIANEGLARSMAIKH